MKKIRFQAIVAFLLCFVLVFSLASASAATATTGLDQSLSAWLSGEGPLRFSGSLELGAYLPFAEEQLPMFNALLGHIAFQASLETDAGGGMATVQLRCDQSPVFTLTERQDANGYALETSLLPNRTLESSQVSPLELLGDTPAATELPFDFLAAITQVQDHYKALISACEPFAEKKRANYSIKGIGSAKWSQIARLTTEQSDAMLPLLRTVLQSGMDPAYRQELDQVRFGKGFIVALYKASENGSDLAVYMKGDLLYPDNSVRKLSYQWAFVDKGTERKDAYKYEVSTTSGPSHRRIVSASTSQKSFTDQLSIKGSSTTTVKTPGLSQDYLTKYDLSGEGKSGDRSLSGAWSLQCKTIQDNDTSLVLQTFTPKLTLSSGADGSILSGTVKVEEKRDKTVVSSLTLTFQEDVPQAFASFTEDNSLYSVQEGATPPPALPASSLMQNADEIPDPPTEDYLVGTAPIGLTTYPVPSSMTHVSMDDLTDEAHRALLGELSQNLAGKLLAALSTLPEEDTALLRDGLTEEDAAKLLDLFGSL